MVHHQYFSDVFKLNGTERTQGNESLPMSQVASKAKHKKQQPQAVPDKAMPQRMEKHQRSKCKTCVCLVGKGSCLGNVLKNKELKLRGQGKQAHVIVGS